MRRFLIPAVAVLVVAVLGGALAYKSATEARDKKTVAEEAGPAPPPEPVTVPMGQAANHVGKKVILLLNDGNKAQGTLEAVKSDALVVKQRLQGGSMSIDIQKSRIQTLQVF